MRPIKPPSETDLSAFISRQRELLAQERNAEVERTSLLLSNCSQKLLEQKGLALGGLGVASINVGLGGKS
jgi:DNA polymerase alpha-associated DNA helicase A